MGIQMNDNEVSWDLLRNLAYEQTSPWIVIGDFNDITSSFEKKDRRLRMNRQMAGFRDALIDCGLNDLGFTSR